jgi:lactam utilization protein B
VRPTARLTSTTTSARSSAPGPDEELFGLISSANVARGFHGGDPRVMESTVAFLVEDGNIVESGQPIARLTP